MHMYMRASLVCSQCWGICSLLLAFVEQTHSLCLWLAECCFDWWHVFTRHSRLTVSVSSRRHGSRWCTQPQTTPVQQQHRSVTYDSNVIGQLRTTLMSLVNYIRLLWRWTVMVHGSQFQWSTVVLLTGFAWWRRRSTQPGKYSSLS